nr:Flp family type IVb pilin [Qipengyuania xiapuensis]
MKRDDRGATAVEYGLILALVFLAMIGAVQSFGQTSIQMWDRISVATQGANQSAGV